VIGVQEPGAIECTDDKSGASLKTPCTTVSVGPTIAATTLPQFAEERHGNQRDPEVAGMKLQYIAIKGSHLLPLQGKRGLSTLNEIYLLLILVHFKAVD